MAKLPPSELESLSRGEFMVYCGLKFEALEARASKLGRHLWYMPILMLLLILAALSIAAATC